MATYKLHPLSHKNMVKIGTIYCVLVVQQSIYSIYLAVLVAPIRKRNDLIDWKSELLRSQLVRLVRKR